MKRNLALLHVSLASSLLGCSEDAQRVTVGYLPGPRDSATPDRESGGGTAADASSADTGERCALGDGAFLPEDVTADVHGDLLAPIVYFASGAALPAGRYRASYVDGCFSCCVTFLDNFLLVGDDILSVIAPLPGGSGEDIDVAPVATCPVSNAPYPDVDFDFAGGKLGVWLSDAAPTDNVNGDGAGGRSPTWRLTRLDPCP